MLKINQTQNVGATSSRPTETIPSMAPPTEPKPSLFKRLKKIKNIEIYLAVAVVLIMVAIYVSSFGGGRGSTAPGASYDPVRVANENFAREKEARLIATLSQVQGAGRVSAMVTVVGSPTLEIAHNIEERTVTQTGANGQTNTTTTLVRTPILVNGRPIILMEVNPRLVGIVVVAQGAGDIGVRLALLRAVQTLVADPSVIIEILTGR